MKTPFLQKFPLLLTAAGLLSCFSLSVQAQGVPRSNVRSEDAQQLTDITAAGLNHDMSQTSVIVLALNNPPHPDFKKAALLALARLGAVDAEPSVNSVIAGSDNDTSSYAKAALARLKAENVAQDESGTAGAAARTSAFLQFSGLTVAQINQAVGEHYKNGGKCIGPQPVEVYALREIADMVYQDKESDFAKVTAISNLNFEQDYPALLKVQLSGLNPAQRVKSIVSDLAGKTTLASQDYYEMQLGVSEGQPASQAAATQLNKMRAAEIKYSPEGFIALLQILHGVGDKNQAALFADLMAQANLEWMYPDIKNGIPHQIVPGY